jgi:hypothetical protein
LLSALDDFEIQDGSRATRVEKLAPRAHSRRTASTIAAS